MGKDYTIGLDIGTNSVGWAVLRDDLDLVKKKMKVFGNTDKKALKKNFWGVSLFDEGQTAADARMKRTMRRRLARRHQRIVFLQEEFFQKAMNEKDANFFHRLNESFLVEEDKEFNRHPIFGKLEEEKAYYKKYPTIYHLRKELADSTQQADLRLVYLAMAHIIKYRGHFLIEGKLSTENTSVSETFKVFLDKFNEASKIADNELKLDTTIDVEKVLTEKSSRSRKAENVLNFFPTEKKNDTFDQFLKMIVGNQGNFKKTFDLDEDAKLQFSKEDYDTELENLLGMAGDGYGDVFEAAKNAYNAVELSGILTVQDSLTKAKLSAGMIKRYDDHKEDLALLKKFFLNNLGYEEYVSYFKGDGKKDNNGYASYIDGHTKQDDFYSYTKKMLDKVEGADYFLAKIDQEDFLRKQRTFDNGVIPHQIHLEELKAIMEHQGEFYPFLKENFQKIVDLFNFRIPYYVGPLASKENHGRFAWLERNSDEPITPWNITEVVDMNKSAEKFIERMTNFDTYLPNEKVLPKHSMLYEKFTVYNELTKVSYTDEQEKTHNFSSIEKEKIFKELFCKNRKVTKDRLQKFLYNEYNLENVTINGIENEFNAKLATYHDFLKLNVSPEMLNDPENEDMFEEIVKMLTIFEDRKMLAKQLASFKSYFDEKTMKELVRRYYTGWGRLSAKLINGLYDQQTGKTVIDFLVMDDAPGKNTNRNFMQLINDNMLSFKEEIQKAQKEVGTKNDLNQIVQELAGSPALKKGILQSLKIVDEIVDIMGYAPTNIVIEMARENQTTGRGKINSQPRYKNLEKSLNEMQSKILKDYPTDNKAIQKDRLYLYYLQNGRDMYTGHDLDINNLSNYDIDHIIPQSFIVDNSIDNRVLVSSKENRGKSDDVLNIDIVKSRKGFWEQLLHSKLMSKKKFDNLTKAERGGITEDDKAGFIKRQLVETRQITKHVARILDERFNTEKDQTGKKIRTVRIVTLKSALTSQFRKNYQIYKVREINDYHHAHDAYLNGVVANTLLKIYPQLEPEFVYGEYHRYDSFKENRATAKKNMYSNIMQFTKKDVTLDKEGNGEILWDNKSVAMVKKVIDYRQMNIVKKTEIQRGGFSNETVLPKGPSDKLIPRKNNWDPAKYGGVGSPTEAYSIIISYEKGKSKKVVKEIVGITIMQRKAFEENELGFLKTRGYENPKVLAKLPKYTLFEFADGRRRLLASSKESQKGNQLVLSKDLNELVYHAKNSDKKSESLEFVTNNSTMFFDFLEYVDIFAQKYIIATKNSERIQIVAENNKDSEGKDLATSFFNLLQFTAMGAPADFKFFNETIPRKRYSSTSELLNATIIYQSVTGLYETRRNLGD
ncbi:type II CRISPR RNA-guided endonuclease Cas9 [Enterococcus timonensis]|uniref:type II CRISPR RNA-guided endonuclease Cas9 n=1 Tax=Enterococcus timonensis TaxID=1852364 RepID=UPI0008DA630B|nr:type II CRISPR RNA-guided endonuclease Cas9 [Enterococcus timonensis]